jgi:hypothetical protein
MGLWEHSPSQMRTVLQIIHRRARDEGNHVLVKNLRAGGAWKP